MLPIISLKGTPAKVGYRNGEECRDHLNRPNSVCRHPDERDLELERVQTVASIIMNLTQREVHLTSGPPCQNEYQTVKFEALQ
jgi:isopenicillin-N N-acyltransferase-like protein